jgi:tetratricopeptide (TPR) repeat protein
VREEDRLADILFDWRERRGRGEVVDPETVIREHPALADRLRSWFLALAAVDEVLSEVPLPGEGAPERVGRYRLVRELGVGGMGTVYLAVAEDGTEVALKLLHSHLLANPGTLHRFHREAKAGRLIDHENVLRTLDVGVAGEHHFLVLEYVEGRTLRALQKDLGTVPEALLREIASQVAAGLGAIHDAGLVHRDLKPENVFITSDRRVRIMDLGIARLIDATLSLTREGQFAGSILYAAPEQLAGAEVGPPADLYSLGVTLHELATGENPFRRASVPAIVHAQLNFKPPRVDEGNGEISAYLAELIAALIEKDPDRRIASAAELGGILAQSERSSWWISRERDLKAAESRRPRIPVRREADLVGRDIELAVLEKAFAEAKEGRGGTVLVEGEAGIGKTRLIDEFLRTLPGEQVQVLYGSYSPFGGRGALSDGVIGRFGETALADSLTDLLPPCASLVPAFTANLLSENLPPEVEPLTGDALHSVFCRLAQALSQRRPTIWVVEDLHFAPADSLRILRSLARSVTGRRALVVLTARRGLPEEELSLLMKLEGFRRMELSRLSPREVVELVRDSLKSAELADRLGTKIAYQSDGVPFFIFEMIRGLEEGEFITEQPDGTFTETKVVEKIETPEAIRELVSARLLGLSRLERSVLDVGAVEGFEFDPDVVARVRGMRRFEVLECLAHLERRSGVVRGAEGVCRFDHHQIQEVLYQALPPDLRSEVHALIAEVLAKRAGTDAPVTGDLAYRLAWHNVKGSRRRAAAPHLLPALLHLKSELRNGEALDLAAMFKNDPDLLDAEERTRVELLRAGIFARTGRYEDEREALEEAHRLSREQGAGDLVARSRSRLAAFLLRHGNLRESRNRAEEAVAAARSAGDRREEVAALTIRTLACLESGLLDQALSSGEEALALARKIEDPGGEAAAAVALGVTGLERGEEAGARRHLLAGRDSALRLGLRQVAADASLALVLIGRERKSAEEALTECEEILAFCRGIGERSREARALALRGEARARIGDVERAEDDLQRALAIDRETGGRTAEGEHALLLGETNLLTGETAAAAALAQQALRLARETEARPVQAGALGLLGRVALAEGRREDARGRFMQALGLSSAPPRIAALREALAGLETDDG